MISRVIASCTSTFLRQITFRKQLLIRNLFTLGRNMVARSQIAVVNNFSNLIPFALRGYSKKPKKPKLSERLKLTGKKKETEEETCDPGVQYAEIKDLPNQPKKLLIDVRTYEEIKETGCIPTAINIPFKSVKKYLGPNSDPEAFELKFERPKPDHDTYIIISCRSGGRAGKTAVILEELGYTNVHVYKGSWLDYAKNEGKRIGTPVEFSK